MLFPEFAFSAHDEFFGVCFPFEYFSYPDRSVVVVGLYDSSSSRGASAGLAVLPWTGQ